MKRTFTVNLFLTFEVFGKLVETSGVLCDLDNLSAEINSRISPVINEVKFVSFRIEPVYTYLWYEDNH